MENIPYYLNLNMKKRVTIELNNVLVIEIIKLVESMNQSIPWSYKIRKKGEI